MKGGKRDMKTAKIGAIFLISVMALAGVSAGYALWFQDLTIKGEIHTGKFCIGIRDVDTGDPGPNYMQPGGKLFPTIPEEGTADLDSNDYPFYFHIDTGDNDEGKNVASTISINGKYKCEHEGVDFYHDITEQVWNAYPWYCSWIYIEFANCGTVPGKIADGRFTAISDPDGIMNFLKVDEVDIFIDGVDVGFYPPSVLEGLQYQLDPCNTFGLKIYFHFEEEWTDEDGNIHIMPQGKTLTFTYQIKWAQWNEVPGAPTVP
jgi:hypothetical protein